VTTPDWLVSGLRTHREIYVPTDDQFARYLDVFYNPSAETITRRVTLFGYLGSEGATVITSSGSGDLLFDAGDNYLATDDGDGIGDLSLAHVLMDGKRNQLASVNRSGANLDWSFDVTIAPGQTVRLMTFAVQQLNRAAAQAQATRLVGLPASALANLTDAEKGSIINFDTGLDTIAPVVASIDPVPGQYRTGTIRRFTVTFSEPMDVTTASDAGNYRLVDVGDDGELGTVDDIRISVTPHYDVLNRQVVLSIANGSGLLPPGNYRLILNGTTGLRDRAGNLLDGGSNQVYEYQVVAQGPSVVAFYAGYPNSSSGWSSFVVSFDQPIDVASFDRYDVQIINPYGYAIPQDQIFVYENGDPASWVVYIPTQFIPGTYSVSLGPDIRNLSGEPMNQNGNFTNGEPYADAYTTDVVVFSGPYVTGFFAGDTRSNPGWSEFYVSFDHEISYFSQYQVIIYSFNTGEIVNQNQIIVTGYGIYWTIDFPAIHIPGNYLVRIGPFIYDYYGNPMTDAYYTVVTVYDFG